MDITTVLTLDELTTATNIADKLTKDECAAIAALVTSGYDADKQSRAEWEVRNAEALKLALQVRENKSEPWEGCSNVKFPLVTIAAMHYHARAYPLLVDGNDLVKARVWGPDPDGKKGARALRVATHMTWQNMEQMDEWESEHDKTLLIQGILGVAVKKRWFDPVCSRQRSAVVGIDSFVVNYFTRGDINEASRATHVMEMTPNAVRERVVRGLYCDDTYEAQEDEKGEAIGEVEPGQQTPKIDTLSAARQARTGETAPPLDSTAPILMLEQMCWLDLDCDGYDEPYFVTVEKDTGKLRRIVARFTKDDVVKKNGAVIGIKPEKCYTKYGLIPAPDGSWYDIGFGHLLGPINASVDTALNQIFDAGTMSTVGGGFLGRGARFKAGQQRFKPYEWKTVDSTGDDLRKNVIPLETKEPSQVLLALLQYLVQYAERTASANDIQTGENPGQNTPAATSRLMNENGARVFAAIFKRTWRAMRDEFRIQFALNMAYLEADVAYDNVTAGAGAIVTIDDYRQSPPFICPAADPTIVSDEARQRRAQGTMQLALQVPGFNRYKAVRRYLEAMKEPAIDEIFPVPQGGDIQSPPDAKMMAVQVKQQDLQLKQQQMQIDTQQEVMKWQKEAQKIDAEILELRARSVMELAQAKGIDQGQQIAFIDAMIGAKKAHMDGISQHVAMLTEHMKTMKELGDGGTDSPSSDGSGAGGLESTPANAGVFSMAQGQPAGANAGVGAG